MSLVPTVDQVTAEAESLIQRSVGIGVTAPGVSAGAINAYLGAAPTYWANLVTRLRSAVHWPTPDSFQNASVFGFVDTVGAVIPWMAYTQELDAAHLLDAVQALAQDAQDAARFYANLALNTALGAVGSASAGAANAVVTSENYANGLFNRAEADLSTWAHALVNSDRTIEANLTGAMNGLFNQAESDLNTWAGALVASDRSLETNLSSLVAARFAQVEGDLTTWAQALVQSDRDIQTNLQMVIVNQSAADRDYADSRIQAFIPAAVAQAVAQVQPQLDRVKTELDTCLAPMCDEVSPNSDTLGKLGKTLTAFKNLGILGLVVGLAAEAVHDPEAAATGAVDALGWTNDVGVGVVDAVMG